MSFQYHKRIPLARTYRFVSLIIRRTTSFQYHIRIPYASYGYIMIYPIINSGFYGISGWNVSQTSINIKIIIIIIIKASNIRVKKENIFSYLKDNHSKLSRGGIMFQTLATWN